MGILSLWSRRPARRPAETDPESDRELVARLLDGDADAFEIFFDRHARAVYRYASSHLHGDSDEVDDVVQATLTHALEGLAGFRGDGPLAAWLVGICRFEISARRRRQRRLGEHVGLDEDDPVLIERAASRSSTPPRPDRRFDRREHARCVHLVLDALPEHYRRVLTGKYVEGLSVRDLAASLATTSKAVESLLTRARVAFDRQWRAVTAEFDGVTGPWRNDHGG